MLLNDLHPKSVLDLILQILWCVTTEEERSLSQFNHWPKAFSYFSKIPIKLEHSSPVALQKIILSLAKNRREIDGPLAHASIPFIVPSSTNFLYLYL